jgi:hypothetical protein
MAKAKKEKNPRSGLALPIETVVIIILAVLVLTILSGYFLNVWGEKSGTAADLQNQLTGKCLEFVTRSRGECDVAKLQASGNMDAYNIAKYIYDGGGDATKKICNRASGKTMVCQGSGIQECLRSCCPTYCG